ncbi:hypothetical protein NL676_039799 [Syzygium grande]|nr:hypothetical protein NL676_039799 [Syzygium grande]
MESIESLAEPRERRKLEIAALEAAGRWFVFPLRQQLAPLLCITNRSRMVCRERRSPLSPSFVFVVFWIPRFCAQRSPAMLNLALRKRADRLGRRMEELDRSIDGVTVRSLEITALHVFSVFQMATTVAAAKSRYMICQFVWMPVSLSLVILAAHCVYFSSDVRRLRRYSAEMERVRAKLNAARRMLLEHCMDHEASLAEVGFGSTTLTWINLVCFAVTSAILTCAVIGYAIFTCAA